MWLPNLADEEAMTDVLARHGDALGLPGEVDTVRLLDARLTHPHRPESPLCRGWATYLVRPRHAAPVHLYVKGFPPGGASEAAWHQDRAVSRSRPSVHLGELDLVVWRFPEDPKLAALPALVVPELAARIMPAAVRDVLGLQPEVELRTTVVRYQPEASATLRLEVDGVGTPVVFAKNFADGTVADVAARQQSLWSASEHTPALRVAEPLAADLERGVLWTRGVTGRPLARAVVPDQLPGATSTIGALLAGLHGSSVHPTPGVTVDGLLVEARKKAAKLALAHPPVATLATELVAAAASRRSDAYPERVCTLHGDFHLDQLVSSAHGPVLVDLDSLQLGAPEVDLAEFLVDLALRELPGPVAHDVARGLLSSYVAATGTAVDAALLDVCADVEFLNRCYRHLRRHSPGWQVDLETELHRHADVTSLLRG